jgi:hypothetical protein
MGACPLRTLSANFGVRPNQQRGLGAVKRDPTGVQSSHGSECADSEGEKSSIAALVSIPCMTICSHCQLRSNEKKLTSILKLMDFSVNFMKINDS